MYRITAIRASPLALSRAGRPWPRLCAMRSRRAVRDLKATIPDIFESDAYQQRVKAIHGPVEDAVQEIYDKRRRCRAHADLR